MPPLLTPQSGQISRALAATAGPCYNSERQEGPKPNMQKPIRTCALVGKFQDPRVAECAQALVPELLARKLTVLVPQDANAARAPAGVSITPLAQMIERTDLMIAIGGDGT